MKKTAVLAAVLLFVSIGAGQIETRYFSIHEEATAGQNTSIGELQVTANSSLSNIEARLDLPFNSSIQPSTKSQLDVNRSFNSSVYVSPPRYQQPANYSRKIVVESQNHSAKQKIRFQVPALNNWTVNRSGLTRNYSLGSSGTLTTFRISQDGNVPDEIKTEVKGDVGQLLQVQPSFQVLPRIPKDLKVVYDIPEGHATGKFNGSIRFTGSNLSRNVNISLQLTDDNRPEIKLTKFPDVEATQETKFKVKAADNLKIQKITGKVYRIDDSGNKTERVKISEFFFQNKDENVYSHVFKETGQEGNYSIQVSAIDGAGNNDTVTGSFRVKPLDVVELYDFNFNIGKVIQGQVENHTVLRLEEKEDVRLAWHKIVPSRLTQSQNTTPELRLGVRHKKWSEPKYFDRLGDSIKLRETGNYSVVAATEFGGNSTHFNAELDIVTPEKHVEERNIIFGGTLIQNFAEPGPFTAAGLTGRTYYSEFEDGVPTEKAVVVKGDASDCRGIRRMSRCISNLNLGKLKNQSQTIQKLRGRVHPGWKYASFAFIFITGLVYWGSRTRWKLRGVQETDILVNYEKIKQNRLEQKENDSKISENHRLDSTA